MRLATTFTIVLIATATQAIPKNTNGQVFLGNSGQVESRGLPACQPTAEYKSCAKENCAEKTCFELLKPQPKKPCGGCVDSCFCRPGYYRDRFRRCVTAEECKRLGLAY
uniref:Putative similar to chymotrypsin-elastase inhibitor ixodidin n=1 Tax=Rhipicephalus pulchellus TaxID=72859 RepID=L7MCB9_RHIPC